MSLPGRPPPDGDRRHAIHSCRPVSRRLDGGFHRLPDAAWDPGCPGFVHINFTKKTIVGSLQCSTAIQYMGAREGQLLMQGTELGYGWNIPLDTKAGGMSVTLVNRDDVFVLFGTCTPS
jgi:hypothetical protein